MAVDEKEKTPPIFLKFPPCLPRGGEAQEFLKGG
jgi:hypothetical protein